MRRVRKSVSNCRWYWRWHETSSSRRADTESSRQEECIAPEIISLNLISLSKQAPYEYLFYSDGIKRLNTGRLPSWILKKYSHIELGGWWSSGIDPITGEDELWGCFKPDHPRIDPKKGKYQKYEHPLKAVATLFASRVSSQHLAQSKQALQRTHSG